MAGKEQIGTLKHQIREAEKSFNSLRHQQSSLSITTFPISKPNVMVMDIVFMSPLMIVLPATTLS